MNESNVTLLKYQILLQYAASRGIASADFDVVHYGLASTPAMFNSTLTKNEDFLCPVDGAIMITASHLPYNRNGFKFFTNAGGLGKADIKDILECAANIYNGFTPESLKEAERKASSSIGTGIFISILSMSVAALVEIKRLHTAEKYGLVDDPNATIPMKVWWLLPQYLLTGSADVFTMVGLQEFFYDQVPSELRSIGLALYLSIFGVGSFISSFLISVVEKTTGGDGKDGWISDNLNRGHLDYFYWLLAGISAVAFVIYLYFAKHYIYNRASTL